MTDTPTPEPLVDRRNPMFAGYCYLCGTPITTRALYCWAHSWAAPR